MEFLIKFSSLCWVLCRYESCLWEYVEYHWWMWWGLSWRYSIWLRSILEQDDKIRWCWTTLRKHVRFYNLLIFYVKSIFDKFKNLHLLEKIKFLFGVKSVFFMNTIFQLDTYLTLFCSWFSFGWLDEVWSFSNFRFCLFISLVHFNQWLYLCAKESSSVSRSIVFMMLYSYLLFFWNLFCGGCIFELVNWILFTNLMSVVPFLCMLFGLCIMWEACLYIKEARLLMKPILSQRPNFSQCLSMSH